MRVLSSTDFLAHGAFNVAGRFPSSQVATGLQFVRQEELLEQLEP